MVDDRINQLRALMTERKIDVYLIPTADFHQSEYVGEYFKCRHFLSGFTGTAGTLVVTAQKAGLWTDGRYFVQAETQLSNTCVELYRMGSEGVPTVEEFVKEHLPVGGGLGFDGRVFSTREARHLVSRLKKKAVSFSCQEDLAGMIWKERPALSKQPIWILEECYAGVSASDKVKKLRQEMKDLEADVHVITVLDELAWLLNLRGDDIPCNPLFLSYGLITEQEFYLFVQREAVGDEVEAYLTKLGVTICPYEDVYETVKTIRDKTILLELGKVNYSISQNIDSSNEILDHDNPCMLWKAIKNPVEIENMKKVHIKDGIAVTKFMYWLKKQTGDLSLDEVMVGNYMDQLRKEQGAIEPSFTTIVAYEENGAMCHYHAGPDQNAAIGPKGLLLVDSGGQYLEGTTDITRTYVMGPITKKEKEYFTLVAMSMLKAGDMKFLHGCRGLNLDYTIREDFWKRNLDFNHGTGHGVGYLSGVHERPNGIRWKMVPERQDSAVIEPGMICSDEPGLYFQGEFGVRIENMILCVEDEKNQYGQFLRFEFLTYAPIDLEGIDVNMMGDADIRRLNNYHKEVYEVLSPHLTEEERQWLETVTRPILPTLHS